MWQHWMSNVGKLWEVMAPKSSQSLAGEPDDVAKTHKVKEKKDGAPEKLPGSAICMQRTL